MRMQRGIRSYPGGAKLRHKILLAVIKTADKMYGGSDWAKPSAKLLAGKSVTVPALRGLTVEAATTLLTGLGFAVGPLITGGVLRSSANASPMAVKDASPVIAPRSLSCEDISVMYFTGASSPGA